MSVFADSHLDIHPSIAGWPSVTTWTMVDLDRHYFPGVTSEHQVSPQLPDFRRTLSLTITDMVRSGRCWKTIVTVRRSNDPSVMAKDIVSLRHWPVRRDRAHWVRRVRLPLPLMQRLWNTHQGRTRNVGVKAGEKCHRPLPGGHIVRYALGIFTGLRKLVTDEAQSLTQIIPTWE